MRICFIVLLTVATLLSSSEAISIPDRANAAKVIIPENDHLANTQENQVPAKRFLRKRDTVVDGEERVLLTTPLLEKTDSVAKVPGIIKKFAGSWAYRILRYNAWIFGNKTPEWVKTNFPAYFDGYSIFYHNRMTRGYKYA